MRIGRRCCCSRRSVARASQSRELISPSLSSQQRPLSLLRWRATAFFLLSMTINPRLRSLFFSLRRPWPAWQQQQCRWIDRFAEVAGICHSLFSPERNPLSGLDIDCESGDPHLPSYPLTDHCPDVRRGQNRSPPFLTFQPATTLSPQSTIEWNSLSSRGKGESAPCSPRPPLCPSCPSFPYLVAATVLGSLVCG